MTGKEMVKKLESDGWALDRVKGSHHIMIKNEKTVVIPVHTGKDLKPGTLRSILKQAGYK
jgi:predicted RNA binding protein YcfA (HicA-like mRNA interferase family)